MTNQQHPALFDWATELSDAQGRVTMSEQEAHEIGARLRSMGAKLKTYEDLGDAADDVQLLRMGYAAARLEIETLQARIKTMAEDHADELMVAHLDGRMRAAQPASAYKDSTPEMHVGDSAFESWYSTYNPAHKSDKQRARDAYAAGMGDPLVMAAPATVAGQDVMAWMTQDGDRVVTARTMDAARRDGGAMLSSLRGYSVAMVRANIVAAAPTTQAQAIPGVQWQCGPQASGFTAPQADSQPAPEYVGNGMFKGETIEKAAEHWANWCDRRCMNGLAEFLRVVAAHALADSVTAPAGPSKSLPYEPTSAMLIAARERDPALPIETVRAIYWSMWRTAPTPPAQAADSVLRQITSQATVSASTCEIRLRNGTRPSTQPAQRRRTRAMAETLEPVVTLVWDKSDDGTYKAVMTVSGLQSEQQAQAAVAHMQRLFCGQEQEPHHD